MAKVFFAFPYQYDRTHANYRVVLREAAQILKHEAIFADEQTRPGDILQHIQECIEDCDAAFFDITGLNPNVLIEFGIGYAAEKQVFLLLNTQLHVTETRSIWGNSAKPIEIPTDLKGTLRVEYDGLPDLAGKLRRALQQNLDVHPTITPIAKRIKEHLRRYGPLNMSGISNGLHENIDKVRPILKSLVTAHEVDQLGRGRGTTYKAH